MMKMMKGKKGFAKVSMLFLIVIGIYSCDAVYFYKILNSTHEELILYIDKRAYHLHYVQEIDTIGLGIYKLEPKREYRLFSGINKLNLSEIPMDTVIIMNNRGDTIVKFLNKYEIFEYYSDNKVLEIE